ncbi:hypothetical protein Tco_0897205 [Tanacetum coccineum]
MGAPLEGPYQTIPHSPDDIIRMFDQDREGQVTRSRQQEDVEDPLVHSLSTSLSCEIVSTLKPLEEIIWENVFCLGVLCLVRLCHDSSCRSTRAKPRRDRGTRRGRHSTSSSSAFDQPSSSHLNDDDDNGNDEGTLRASTPSPIRYVNSLTN